MRYVSRCFQYPQTDRTSCDVVLPHNRTNSPKTFSILKRIEPHATVSVVARTLSRLHFQYPQTDRTSCDFILSFLTNLTKQTFQYPQTDRTSCDALYSFALSDAHTLFNYPQK